MRWLDRIMGRDDVSAEDEARSREASFVGITGGADNPHIMTISRPNSAIAEEFRKLKSVVLDVTKREGFLNAVMVTSALAGEG